MIRLSCPSCGASDVRRGPHKLVCAFCQCEVRPALEPGTLCADGEGGRPCGLRAESLCDGCGVPLCDRHNDRKSHYSRTPLDIQNLCPEWDARDLREWARWVGERLQVPVEGVLPAAAWKPLHAGAVRAAGDAEEAIWGRVRPVAQAARGDLREDACVFDNHCTACFQETSREIEAIVAKERTRFWEVAVRDLLAALIADAGQALSYVEGVAGISQGAEPDKRFEEGPVLALTARSPRAEWISYSRYLEARLESLRRLRSRLREPDTGGAAPGVEAGSGGTERGG